MGGLPAHATRIEAARTAERAGEWTVALRLYEDALNALPRSADARPAIELFRWIGHVRRNLGDVELAVEAYETSHELAVLAGLPGEVASALNSLGILEQVRGQVDVAKELYQRAQVLAMEAGETRLTALIAQNLGTLADISGDGETAVAAFTAAVRELRTLNDALGCIWALNNLGISLTNLERWREAEAALDEAFRLADRERNSELLGGVEVNRAHLFIRRGAFPQARECCDRAFELFSRNGSQLRLGETLKAYGMIFREMRRPGLADEHFTRAAEIASDCEYRLLEAEIFSEWAKLHLREERTRAALDLLNRAHRLFEELHASRELGDLERRLDGVEETYLAVVRTWAVSIEAADRYTAGHCDRVADLTCRIAEALGFRQRDLAWIRMGAFLHDVGKINVPDEVLNKPGKLDEREWQLIRRHTTDGDAIVAELNFPFEIRPMVRSHHERIDGGGYPDGLKGDEIPFTARILGIADVFDALTTARSYRPALSVDEALRIMDKDVGTAFDPVIYECFRACIAWSAEPNIVERLPIAI